MKKILFLSSRLPYPPIGGEKLKNFWLLKILSKYYNVHLVSIADNEPPTEFFEWAKDLGITHKIFKKKKLEFYKNALNFVFNKLPIQVNYYYFKDIQGYLNSIYEDFDLVFPTLIRTAKYVINYDNKKILDMSDSKALSYIKSNKKVKSIMWRVLYFLESNRLLEFEKLCIKRFNKTLFFNREEREFFGELQKTCWIPHGVNEELLKYEKKNKNYQNYIIFFGKMDYQPNIDAVIWFVENILTAIDKNLIFCIVGAYPPVFLKKLEKKYKNVRVTGFVDDPYEIIKSSVCVVSPMQTGGGIQNKILESMALGAINIVSTLAAKPIGATNNVHFIVEDNPQQIAKIINDIYIHSEQYEEIKVASKDYISANFTWSIYEKKITDVIKETLNC